MARVGRTGGRGRPDSSRTVEENEVCGRCRGSREGGTDSVESDS